MHLEETRSNTNKTMKRFRVELQGKQSLAGGQLQGKWKIPHLKHCGNKQKNQLLYKQKNTHKSMMLEISDGKTIMPNNNIVRLQ